MSLWVTAALCEAGNRPGHPPSPRRNHKNIKPSATNSHKAFILLYNNVNQNAHSNKHLVVSYCAGCSLIRHFLDNELTLREFSLVSVKLNPVAEKMLALYISADQ